MNISPTASYRGTLGNNDTTDDLLCSGLITDLQDDTINVTVVWYKDNVSTVVEEFNNSYTNGSQFNATLDSSNTSVGDIWICELTPNDGTNFGDGVNSTEVEIVTLTLCGNNVAEGIEKCDGTDLAGETCDT